MTGRDGVTFCLACKHSSVASGAGGREPVPHPMPTRLVPERRRLSKPGPCKELGRGALCLAPPLHVMRLGRGGVFWDEHTPV